MIPSQSAVRAWDSSHLTEHAAHWRDLATRRRSVVGAIKAQGDSLDWTGQADDAMKAAMAGHLSTAEDEAALLDSAAQTAEGGASVLHQQQQSMLSGVDQAWQSGFAVGEEWGTVDAMYAPGSMGWYARQPTAQAISADLRTRAAAFAGQEMQTATDVVSAAGDLGGEGAVRGHIQAVQAAALTTHAQGATTAQPAPPAATAPPISVDALTGADVLIRQLSAPPVSSPAPVSPAPAAGAMPGIGARLFPAPAVGGVLSGAGSGGGAGAAGAGWGGGMYAMATQLGAGAVSSGTNAIATPAALGAAWAAAVPATTVAHVQSQPAAPNPSPTVQFADPGQAQQEQTPQPAPATDAPPTRQPPAAQSSAPTAEPAPSGTGALPPPDGAPAPGLGGGVQLLGFGTGPAPQAPRLPPPLDPEPAPPPVPKNMTPEQVRETYAGMSTEELRALYEELQSRYRDRCLTHRFILPQEQAGYSSCLAELGTLKSFESELRARGVQILPPGAEPAPSPGTPQPGTPGAQPQPDAPAGPNLDQQATQIGKDVMANVPKGSRLNTLVDRLSQLHIGDQQQAA